MFICGWHYIGDHPHRARKRKEENLRWLLQKHRKTTAVHRNRALFMERSGRRCIGTWAGARGPDIKAPGSPHRRSCGVYSAGPCFNHPGLCFKTSGANIQCLNTPHIWRNMRRNRRFGGKIGKTQHLGGEVLRLVLRFKPHGWAV